MHERAGARRRIAAYGAFALLGAAWIPSDARLSATDQSLTVVSGGRVLSTATVCPGFAFVPLGLGAPRFSPDLHWILVDVRGPFSPGNVVRNHALVQVATGHIALSADFKALFGVPATSDALAWASGERATLRYADGRTATLKDPPLRALPAPRCVPGSGGA